MGERAACDDAPGNPAFAVGHVLKAMWVVQFFVVERPRLLQELVICLALLTENILQRSDAVEVVDCLVAFILRQLPQVGADQGAGLYKWYHLQLVPQNVSDDIFY